MPTTINPSDQTITQYNIQTGGASNLLNNVAPSATSGVPVISQGASAQPIFGTAVVAGGGTGAVTLTGVLTGNGTSAVTASTVTQHGVLLGGATNAVGSTAVGTTGQILQANTSADPTYSTATYPSTTTVSQILYSSSANVVGGLATANNGVLITSATGVPSLLADGTTGQVLTATTGSPPSWGAAAAGGSLVKIATLTASSSASLSFTSSNITATYSAYLIIFNTIISASNGVNFNMDLSVNNGTGYLNSNYSSGVATVAWNGTTITSNNSSSTIPLCASNSQSSTYPTSGQIYIYGAGVASYINGVGQLVYTGNSHGTVMFAQTASVTVNNIKFSMSSGNIASGTITLYGLVQ